eukprot:308540_1
MMSLVLQSTYILLAVIIPTLSRLCCEEGHFNDTTTQCMYACEHGVDEGIQVSFLTLTFDDIVGNSAWNSMCSSIYYTNKFKPSECSTMNDLVWPSCSCPSCSCSTVIDDEYVYYEKQHLFRNITTTSRICGKCKCSENNDNILVYSCDTQKCTNNITSCHTYNGETYSPNESWFNATDDCDQFCICNSDGSISCATGFEDIFEGPNENISNAFIRDCGDNLAVTNCMDDWTKFIGGEPQGSGIDKYCPNCPRCIDCGLYIPGDIWWKNLTVVNQDAGFLESLCYPCKCQNGSIYLNETYDEYVECGRIGSDIEPFAYVKENGGCPPNNTIKCMEGYNKTIQKVDTILLTGQVNGYCTWKYDSDRADEYQYVWSVQASYWDIIPCDAFVGDKQCIRYDTHKYLYCCQGDYCNNINVDISQCVYNPHYNEFSDGVSSCYDYGKKTDEILCEHHVSNEFFFLSDLPKRCSIAWELIQTTSYTCICEWYSKISQNVSSSSKQSLENYINYLLDTYNQIYKFVGCDLRAKCNLSSGTISGNPAYSMLPTVYPTISPVPSIITTSAPIAATITTLTTTTTRIIGIKDSAEISGSLSVKMSDGLIAIIIIFCVLDIILIICCVYYTLNNLISRTKKK